MADALRHKHPFIFASVLIGAAAFCSLIPWFWCGIPSGHDFEYHFNSWIEVLAQWRQGIIYPHWSALAHFGYGEVRYIFYPPASWTLGAILGAILPWKIVSGAYNWLALTLSGLSMFALARRWTSPTSALFAAVFYAINPYHLVIVYWRSAEAELLAASYLPLLFLFVLELGEDGARVIAPLSLVVAAAWLTNIPTAVMLMYSLGVLALWAAASQRSWKALLHVAAAIVLGMGTAAIYLLPVMHQHSWVNLRQVLLPGIRPLENFLFTVTRDEDHNRFNRIVSVVALWEIVILVVSLWIAHRRSSKRIWELMLLWGTLSTVLMINFTLPLWNHVPVLEYVQFPWRWLLCLNVVLALVVVFALERWWLRVVICGIAIASVPFVWHRIQPPWWDTSADIQEMVDNQHDGIGNDGTDEYVPAGADPSDIDQNAPLAMYQGSGTAQISVEKWQSEQRALTVTATSPGNLTMRLFNYPLWLVDVNGHLIQTQSTDNTIQMIIPIPAGRSRIQISWVEGWDRKVGGGISAASVLLLGFLWIRCKHSVHLDTSAKANA